MNLGYLHHPRLARASVTHHAVSTIWTSWNQQRHQTLVALRHLARHLCHRRPSLPRMQIQMKSIFRMDAVDLLTDIEQSALKPILAQTGPGGTLERQFEGYAHNRE